MKSMLRARLTYANVMATIAVFLALGGGSIAAVSGPDGLTDGSAQEQGGDAGGDGDGAGSPGGGGDSAGEDSGDPGDEGGGDSPSNGGGGDGNDTSGDGDGGTDGDSDGDGDASQSISVITREGDAVLTDSATDQAAAEASCEGDERLVGGGVRTHPQGSNAEPVLVSSAPDGDTWSATVQNGSGMDRVRVTAYALCAPQSP